MLMCLYPLHYVIHLSSCFQVSVYMPLLRTLKNVTDRMKNLSNYVTLMANMEGDMKLYVETDLAKVTTRFELLERPTQRKL